MVTMRACENYELYKKTKSSVDEIEGANNRPQLVVHDPTRNAIAHVRSIYRISIRKCDQHTYTHTYIQTWD